MDTFVHGLTRVIYRDFVGKTDNQFPIERKNNLKCIILLGWLKELAFLMLQSDNLSCCI